jgi:predicted MPP superfamily phosphohydrolase
MLMPLLLWILIILFILPPWTVCMFFFLIWRLIVNFIVWASRPDLVAHLTSRDIVFTSDDFDGKVRKNLTNCAVVDGPIDLAQFRTEVKKRIIDRPYYQRLNCRPVIFFGYYFWQKQDYQVSSKSARTARSLITIFAIYNLFANLLC